MDAKILAVYPYEKIDYFVHFAALAPFLPSPAGSPKRSIIAAKRTLCDRQELEEPMEMSAGSGLSPLPLRLS